MTRHGMLCLLLGSIFWYQTVSSSSLTAQTTVAPEATARSFSYVSDTSNIAQDRPAITIVGFCNDSSVDHADASQCKTIITRAQFEKIIDAIQPDMPTRTRREFAMHYADALVMAQKAEQMGLDKGANYEEQIRLARIQVLSQDLKNVVQEKASQTSNKEIKNYYNNNIARFEKAQVDRIYIPKNQQPPPVPDKKLINTGTQERSLGSDQRIKDEANNLHARAVAGEEFAKLQEDAYQVAGIRGTAPSTIMIIRRTSLPPNQAFVIDLNTGEISSVLSDPNGYVIYRINKKDVLSLDQARDEIKATVRSQHIQDEMRFVMGSATPILDEGYFAP
jgi:hypothetical protein